MKKHIRTIACAALAATLALGVVGCSKAESPASSGNGSNGGSTQQPAKPSYVDSVEADDKYATGVHHVKVTVKGYDSFTIAIDADNAPVTSSNFCKLVEDGFYDGLTFHRAVSRFCLQGGDPQGNGMGGSSQHILGEFSTNGVTNELADNYDAGVVAMARANDPNSAASQFFITLSADYASSLNGRYAAFGTISKKGMKVVDKIVADCVDSADIRSGAINKKSKQPVIEKMTIVD